MTPKQAESEPHNLLDIKEGLTDRCQTSRSSVHTIQPMSYAGFTPPNRPQPAPQTTLLVTF